MVLLSRVHLSDDLMYSFVRTLAELYCSADNGATFGRHPLGLRDIWRWKLVTAVAVYRGQIHFVVCTDEYFAFSDEITAPYAAVLRCTRVTQHATTGSGVPQFSFRVSVDSAISGGVETLMNQMRGGLANHMSK